MGTQADKAFVLADLQHQICGTSDAFPQPLASCVMLPLTRNIRFQRFQRTPFFATLCGNVRFRGTRKKDFNVEEHETGDIIIAGFPKYCSRISYLLDPAIGMCTDVSLFYPADGERKTLMLGQDWCVRHYSQDTLEMKHGLKMACCGGT